MIDETIVRILTNLGTLGVLGYGISFLRSVLKTQREQGERLARLEGEHNAIHGGKVK